MRFNLNSFVNQSNIKRYTALVKEINKAYQSYQSHINPHNIAEFIPNEIRILKENTKFSHKKKTIHAIALAKYAAQHILGMSYYDVQIMGALALIDGAMAEMKTGEGKTLTCSAAVIVNYVLGYQTHVATANEYLAQRDAETLFKLYEFMGIKCSFNIANMLPEHKKIAYQADVLYSTAQELGFDFLRDNLIYEASEKIQPRNFSQVKCIIDEADFVLIDEARTPLIISGASPLKPQEVYYKVKEIVSQFKAIDGDPDAKLSRFEDRDEDGDFWLDKKQYNVYLSESGYHKLEQISLKEGLLNMPKHHYKEHMALYDENNSWLINEAVNALKAMHIYQRDKEYIVQDGKVIIIDSNTGRLSVGRTWSNGLHQAIEAKENLVINPENMTMGSISIQNYLRNYQQISGMSGTIMQSSDEFEEIYHCKTIRIPTNKPVIRKEYQDQIYLTQKVKYEVMLKDIQKRHNNKQPILIGTTSVAESEIISNLLTQAHITHHVLNAKNNALEAQIISQAGQPSRVTVATSMAGRGTDIILGGNKESIHDILEKQLQQIHERIEKANLILKPLRISGKISILLPSIDDSQLLSISMTQTTINSLYDDAYFEKEIIENGPVMWNTLYQTRYSIIRQLEILEKNWNQWREEVLQAGGLCVIGSSRNESRRIDDQLKGRAGRQGDPGENIFYMSLEDPWVNVFGKNPLFAHLIKTLPPNQLISSPTVSKVFAKAQKSIEGYHFDMRKNTYQYDSITDEGRRRFLHLRNDLLFDKEAVKELLSHQLYEDLSLLTHHNLLSYIEEKHQLDKTLHIQDVLNYPLDYAYQLIDEYTNDEAYQYHVSAKVTHPELIIEKIHSELNQISEEEWQQLTSSLLRDLDNNWSHHLSFMEEAQKNVGFSSLAQKNPVYEYKKICFQSFSDLMTNLKLKMVEEFLAKLSTEKAIDANVNIT